MILSAQSIRARMLETRRSSELGLESLLQLEIRPFVGRTVSHGMSFGLSAAGYDLRIKDELVLYPGDFALATTVEYLRLPSDLLGQLVDKSTWARRGVAVQNTVFEPGWFGYPTLEVSNHGKEDVLVPAGAPIAQMIFHVLDQATDRPYSGRYQDQPQVPTPAIIATEDNVG